jgi:hypothetical protein
VFIVFKKQIFEDLEKISVLAGKKKIEDMLVYLAYRKLTRLLDSSERQDPVLEDGKGERK